MRWTGCLRVICGILGGDVLSNVTRFSPFHTSMSINLPSLFDNIALLHLRKMTA